ncbi:sodium:solute symporter family protein [Halomonas denitrificans]|uniref:sodium:solute symporter family protein n=1 Tax=Halomonas denitrificans TaxID=370769 RepID=UPI001CD7B375|nr:sodium:solute symporter family protein [Halomonas denitrificans]MCA0975521.1 sodium:solute symporter family protein [Halomonas denitrificans]
MTHKGILLLCFGGYILLMFLVSHLTAGRKKHQSGEDFTLAGRSVPLFLIVGSAVATQVGTGSSMGATGFAYEYGWAAVLYGIGMALGISLCGRLFSHARAWEVNTMSEEIGVYYEANPWMINLVTVGMYLASVGWLGAHIVGGGTYLSWLTGMDGTSARLIVGVVVALFVLKDGYAGVTWIASVQAVILFIGFVVLAIAALSTVGGFEGLREAAPEGAYSFLGLDKLNPIHALSIVFAEVMATLAVPSFRQRIYSSRDEGSLRKGFYITALISLSFCFIPPILGMTAYANNPALEQVNFAFPYLAMTVLPLWLGAIALISGLSATMSSAAGDASAAMNILVNDVYQLVTGHAPRKDKVVLYSKIGVSVSILAALIGTLTAESVLTYITSMVGLLLSGQAVAGVMGRLWPRATWQGGLAAIGGGVLGALVFQLVPSINAIFGYAVFPAMLTAIVAGVGVSLVTPAPTLSQEQSLAIIKQKRIAA